MNKNFGKKGKQIMKRGSRKIKQIFKGIKTWLNMGGGRQMNMGNPLGGLPVYMPMKRIFATFIQPFLMRVLNRFLIPLSCFTI